MTVKAVELKPGWLARQYKSVEALSRANHKLIDAAGKIRRNGYTQPMTLTFTIVELRALTHSARIFEQR